MEASHLMDGEDRGFGDSEEIDGGEIWRKNCHLVYFYGFQIFHAGSLSLLS